MSSAAIFVWRFKDLKVLVVHLSTQQHHFHLVIEQELE